MDSKTIRITERVFDLEDYSDVKRSLERIREDLIEREHDFIKNFHNLMIDENQKGKVIDHLGESTLEVASQNLNLLLDLEESIEEVIAELTEEVNNMNRFTMSITYTEDKPTP